jgi:hypothetical protein
MAIRQNCKREKEASIDIHASTAMLDLIIMIIIISNDNHNHIRIRNMHTYSCLKEKMTPKLSFWSAKPLLFGFTLFQ